MGDSLGGLAILPTRPPTPPKDVEADSILDYPSYLPNSTRHSISTPDDSPSSSAEYLTKSNKFSKRVDFSPWISYTPPSVTAKGISRPDQQRLLPPSRECRSSRSILKPYDTTSHWESISLIKKDRKPLPEMLEELCRQLASASRSPRLDAYMALNDCLKAYKDVPDQPALESKLPLLTGFIRRDLLATLTSTGAIDVQIIVQALKLLTTLIWTVPSITSLLQDDFCAFVVDQAITSFGDSQNISKAIIGQYLHVLSIQKFGPKVMTNERVGRLLDTIQGIHIKGNGIVGQRLIIYRRLLSQAKSLMAARANDWVDHLFTGMLSTLKEIRRRALDFGLEAALNLGSMSQTSRCVLEIFERRSAEGKKFRELLIRRLNDMINSPDEFSHVPPIWSVVIMFFQSRRNQLEQWEHMRVWLSIIQKCFNHSDKKAKFQATLAWNRLIYTVSPDATTKIPMVRMLRQPMMPLYRNPRSVQVKSHASSSYCTLLYYVFRPGASNEQLDRFWAEYVDPILPASLSASEVDTTFACQILIALFGDAQQKTWTENRGHEGHIVKPEELPRLDPRWTRLRASTIMKLFEIMFISANWKASKNEEIWILQAWSSFTKALGDASTKEVKVSVETIGAVAHILNSIKHFWSYSTSTQTPHGIDSSQSIILRRLILIVKLAVENMGNMAFTEKRLTRGTNELFEAAETPSSRTNHTHGILSSPIVHLIEMLSSSISLDEVHELYKQAIADWVQIAVRGSTLRQNKFKVLHEIAFLNMTGISQPEVKPILWQVILDCIDIPTMNLGSRMETTSPSLGHEYRDVVKILEVGIRLSFEPSQSWPTLIQPVVDGAKQEIGVGGVALAIIEPLANSLTQEVSKRYDAVISRCGAAIVQNTMWPRSRKEMEHAHRALWGTSTTSPKVNPFDHLYLFTDSLLLAAYLSFRESAPSNTKEILRASISILSSCPPSLLAVLLQRIQCGLAKWLEDADGLMDGVSAYSKSIFPVVQQLGNTVTKSIEALPNFDSKHLSAIETLFLAGLSSRHKSIANQSINLWNHTFGASTDMEYSESLRKKLSRLNRHADIAMQKSNIEEDLESVSSSINFIETQDSFDDNVTRNLEIRDGKEMDLPSSTTKNPEYIGPSKPPDVLARNTPEPPQGRNGPEKTSNLRLRHENSQIEFAAIESSPYDLDALESQFLTTRQKEVKERQQQEAAAMFPDLRSSPGPKSRSLDQDLPKLYQDSRRVTRDQDLPEEMSSPILPPADPRMIDTFVGSSPTPRSNRHSTNRASRLEDPPSSPPAVACLTTVSRRTNTSNNPRLLAFERPRTPNSAQISDSNPEPEVPYQNPTKSTNETNDESDHKLELPGKVILNRDEDDSDIKLPGTSQSKDNAASDLDILPDAQPTRSSSKLILGGAASYVEKHQELHGKRALEDVAQKSPEPQSGQTTDELHDSKTQNRTIEVPYEQASVTSRSDQAMAELVSPDLDEQISAQIAMDMERALSQADLPSPDVSPTVAMTDDGKKKRKRGAGVPVRSSKRHKSRKPPAVQVVVERRQSPAIEEEEMYDCIVVASQIEKEAQNPLRSISKKQQSSISVPSSESFHSTTPASRKRKSSSPEHSAVENLPESDTKQPKKRKSDLIDVVADMADPPLSRKKRRRAISRSSEEDLNSMSNERLTRSSLTKAMSSTKTMGSHLSREDGTSTRSHQDRTVTAPLLYNTIEESSHSEHGTSELTDVPVRNNSISTLPCNELGAKREPESPSQLEGHSSPVHEISPHPALSTSSANGDTNIALETVSSEVEKSIKEDRSMPVTKEDLRTRLKLILRDAKHVTLDPTEALDLMSTWMEVGKELQEAGGRSTR